MSSKQYYENYWRQEAPPPLHDPTTDERKRLLLAALRRQDESARPKRTLDAGCGDGQFLAFLAGHGFEVSGVDLSETAIESARRRCPSASLQVGSLEAPLAFPSQTFDAVWCTEILEHLFDVPRALGELNRVLSDRGLLILTTPHHGLLKNLAIALTNFERHFDVTGPHIRFFTRRSLFACLARAGFEPIQWRGIGRFWPLSKSFFVVARKVRQPDECSPTKT